MKITSIYLYVFVTTQAINAQNDKSITVIKNPNTDIPSPSTPVQFTPYSSLINPESFYDKTNISDSISAKQYPSTATLNSSGELKRPHLFFNEMKSHNPSMFDFNRSQTNKLLDKVSFVSSAQKVTYIGLGEYTQVNGALRWQPSNAFSIDAGGFASRQFSFVTGMRKDRLGLNINTVYALSDKVQFNVWGQYTTQYRASPFNSSALFPHTGAGSSVVFKINNNANINSGLEYQYNENKRSWNLESKSKVSLKF